MKKCSKCKLEKRLDEFYNFKNSKDGKSHHCKECMCEYRYSKAEHYREYMKDMRLNNNEVVKETRRKSWRNLDPRKRLLQQCKNRANRKNIEFDLSINDIDVPEICPYLEVPFVMGIKGDYQYTYSLDRIDNSKGYIKGNVQVISMKANSMKNSATKEELIKFALKILKDYEIVQTDMKISESKDKEP